MNVARFENLPPRIAKLQIEARGFPVPWFVEWIEGKPDFRVVSAQKMAHAVKFECCWICGEKLGKHKAFVIGPMCGVNRTISEPPSHRDCAIWAAQNCPFLSHPHAKRNERGLPEDRKDAAGFGLKRNPGACAVWITRDFSRYRAHAGTEGMLFRLGEPEEILWFAEGRQATRAEIDRSVDTGLPSLYELAEQQGVEARQYLEKQVVDFRKMLDADPRLV